MSGVESQGRPLSLLQLAIDASLAVLLIGMLIGIYVLDRGSEPDPTPVVVVPAEPPPEIPEPPVIEVPVVFEPPPPPPPPEIEPPESQLPPVDPELRLAVQHSRDGRFGVTTTSGNPDDRTDDGKKLTFSHNGETNNTRVWVDGETPLFGSPPGRMLRVASATAEGAVEFEWEYRQIQVTQSVQPVAGPVSRRMDAVRVEYRLTNLGSRERTVGIRIMLDSLIGTNDGVPFIVPGREGIVQEPLTFQGDNVPDFIRALEVPNLVNPGVIADLDIQAEDSESPSEVVLAHWPRSTAAWNFDRRAPLGNDSAIGLYYEPRPLSSGESRVIRFRYGLGTISSTQSQNASLSLTTGGAITGGARFWLVALVQNPQDGQQVRVVLPEGMSLVEHPPEKPVEPGAEFTQLSWLVQIAPGMSGSAEVEAILEPGDIRERLALTIESAQPELSIVPQGPFISGSPFWVVAFVHQAQPSEQAELILPAGLQLADGHAAIKPLVAGSGASRIDWLVQAAADALGPKDLVVRLGSDGVEANAMVTIEKPNPQVTLVADGPFRVNKPVWIAAVVQHPTAGQTVELTLPSSLTFADGHVGKQTVDASSAHQQFNWLVVPTATAQESEIVVELLPERIEKKTTIEIDAGNLIE